MTADIDLDRLADLLRNTAEMSHVDVALELADIGPEVLPTILKEPMMTARHIRGTDRNGESIGEPCRACLRAGLAPAADHGATTDPDTIRRYWSVHPEAGVGMKAHPRLVRGDADHDDAASYKKARKSIGYGHEHPEPLTARTPGGMYRRRYLHTLPEGVPAPGGGTNVLGVSWYGSSGYVVVKGGHPSGKDYPPFTDGNTTITPLPETVALVLQRTRSTTDGTTVHAANSADVERFLSAHVGTKQLDRMAWRRKLVATEKAGDRHHQALGQLVAGFREAIAGYYPARTLADAIHDALGEAGWTTDRLEGDEWADLVAYAVGKVQHLDRDAAVIEITAEQYDRAVAQFEDRYDPAYLEAMLAEVPRDFTDAELDRITATLAGETVGTDDGSALGIVAKFLTIDQLAALPPPQPLIDGILDLDNVSITYGRRGSYKSFVLLDMALSVATGNPWHDHAVTMGTVVYVVGEGKQGVYQRIDAWLSQWPGKEPGDRLLILPEAVNLLNDAAVHAFAFGCQEVGASFVILDTLARCIPGGDENSARDMGIAVEAMDTIRRMTGAHVDAVHHSGKDSKAGARGSSALEGASDTVIEVSKSDTAVTLTQTKQKNRAEGPPLRFLARPVRSSVVLDAADNAHVTVTPKPREALRLLDEIAGTIGATFTAWTEAAQENDIGRTTVRRIRVQALEKGWIENGPNGTEATPRYVVTEAGRAIAQTGSETARDVA